MAGRSLLAKQKKFCVEYLVDFNATQAAIRSKYSEKAAHSIGQENLTKPAIKKEISRLQRLYDKKAMASGNIMTLEQALEGFSKIANFDVRKLYNGDGTLKNITELDDATAYAVSAVDVKESFNRGKSKSIKSLVKKIKTSDKIKALDAIVRRYGGYEADNRQKRINIEEILAALPKEYAGAVRATLIASVSSGSNRIGNKSG